MIENLKLMKMGEFQSVDGAGMIHIAEMGR